MLCDFGERVELVQFDDGKWGIQHLAPDGDFKLWDLPVDLVLDLNLDQNVLDLVAQNWQGQTCVPASCPDWEVVPLETAPPRVRDAFRVATL
jgi:hypothetical protein